MNLSKILDKAVDFTVLGVIYLFSTYWIPWILTDVWPRVLTIPVVVVAVLYLLVRGLWSGIKLGLVERSPILVGAIRLGKNLLNWIRIGVAGLVVAWMLFVGGSTIWKQNRIRSLAEGLSWQASEYWIAICLGNKISQLTGAERFELDARFLPTFAKFNNNISHQQMLVQSAVDELGQKGIMEKHPLHPVPRSITQEEFRKLPDNVIPTSLGKDLCAYYLCVYEPQKTQAISQSQ